MHYWVCADDTDMPGTKGTGWLLQGVCEEIEEKGMGACTAISRHQLFVHEDVPFTSHNSAMSFEIDLADSCPLDQFIPWMTQVLESRSQKGSDPGLCVTGHVTDTVKEKLMDFGHQAKHRICTKQEAYSLAHDLGLHLSEHGGTGDGIIGALAGTGLRLSGNDGRYRGWYHLGKPGDVVDVKRLCQYPFIDGIVRPSGADLAPEEKVAVGSYETKTVRLGSRRVVVVVDNEAAGSTGIPYRTITKQEAKNY